MPFPKGESELLAAGYKYEAAGRCKSTKCNREIAWYTTPKGRLIPLNKETLEPHFATCADVEHFRRGKN